MRASIKEALLHVRARVGIQSASRRGITRGAFTPPTGCPSEHPASADSGSRRCRLTEAVLCLPDPGQSDSTANVCLEQRFLERSRRYTEGKFVIGRPE